ncbi:polysaccharide biosynthesis C-terminal domain-containing protein [Schleiferiaceae bacterium]|nr:polysaccharide biosynthesis C-terminal domain-containing protein [Schleiferiaceae bacterium]
MIIKFQGKSFLKDSFIYTIGNVLPSVGAAIFLPLYLKYLTSSEYGLVSHVQVIQAFSFILFSLAIDRAVLRLIFDCKTDSERREFLGTAFVLVGIATLIGSVLTSALWSFWSFYAVSSTTPNKIYFLGIVVAMLKSLLVVPRAHLQVTKRPIPFVGLAILEFIVTNSSIYYFVVIRDFGTEGMLWAYVLGAAAVLPFGGIIILENSVFTLKKSYVSQISRFSLPIVPTLITALVLNMSDRIFIEQYIDMSNLGVYSVAFKIVSVAVLFISGFNLAITPRFYEKLSETSFQHGILWNKKFNISFLYIMSYGTILFLLILPDVVENLFSEEYNQVTPVASILLLSFYFSSVNSVNGKRLAFEKRTKQTMWIDLSSAIINVLLNFLLIPVYGLHGAAIATALSTLWALMINFWYLRFVLGVDVFPTKLFFIATVLILGIIATSSIINFEDLVLRLIALLIVIILLLKSLIKFAL